MNIIICGSMSSAKKMVEIKNELTKAGHNVVLPKLTEEIIAMHPIELDGDLRSFSQ